MIEYQTLADDHPDLLQSPLLRAALLTLQYTQEHGSIGITKTKAFKRTFVHWAVQNFDWPGEGADEVFRHQTVVTEADFAPLEVLHFLLIDLRLGRHFKDEFRLTKRGKELSQAPGRLFVELIPCFIHQIDHTSYARFDDLPFGNWDGWMNVINVEADHGISDIALYQKFYGEPEDDRTAARRDIYSFSACVLRPLEWAGLLVSTHEHASEMRAVHLFKSPLWRNVLKLDTDDMLQTVPLQ
tara:strand:- start:5560 stop:6282 length:723 start_codon:yes stop_codon:yes gene_type:complete